MEIHVIYSILQITPDTNINIHGISPYFRDIRDSPRLYLTLSSHVYYIR